MKYANEFVQHQLLTQTHHSVAFKVNVLYKNADNSALSNATPFKNMFANNISIESTVNFTECHKSP